MRIHRIRKWVGVKTYHGLGCVECRNYPFLFYKNEYTLDISICHENFSQNTYSRMRRHRMTCVPAVKSRQISPKKYCRSRVITPFGIFFSLDLRSGQYRVSISKGK